MGLFKIRKNPEKEKRRKKRLSQLLGTLALAAMLGFVYFISQANVLKIIQLSSIFLLIFILLVLVFIYCLVIFAPKKYNIIKIKDNSKKKTMKLKNKANNNLTPQNMITFFKTKIRPILFPVIISLFFIVCLSLYLILHFQDMGILASILVIIIIVIMGRYFFNIIKYPTIKVKKERLFSKIYKNKHDTSYRQNQKNKK